MKVPLQIVELRQPRCSRRFGVAPCPATGTPLCYNTFATCPTDATRAVYLDTGSIYWRFVANAPGQNLFGSFGSANAPRTNGIPVNNLSVSLSKGQLNIGGMLDGKSPFGVRAACSVTMDDFAWGDQVGDFYLASRSALPVRTFWTTFLARVKLFSNIQIVIYDGYQGDTLAAMRQRLYVLDGIDGPSNGRVTLRGIDPLMLASKKRAQFPPAMNMSLMQDLTANATILRVSTDDVTNLSTVMGITSQKHLVIGSEIIGYTGYTTIDTGTYDVTGLTRGMGGTTPASASAGDAVARAGHFEDQLHTDIAKYLLQTWTTIPDAWIDLTGWDAERDDWMSLFSVSAFVTQVTAVEDLIGELCQQAPMFIWWDEYAQLIRLQGIHPPTAAVAALDDDITILADSATLTRVPDSRLTRVFIYSGQKVATSTDQDNWQYLDGVVNGTGELSEAGGEPRLVSIFGRWIAGDSHAFIVADRIMAFYIDIPRILSFDVSAKDRDMGMGTIFDATTRVSTDTEGRSITERWMVTSWEEVVPGQTYHVTAQWFPFSGRFGNYMDVTAHDYPSATTIEKATGGFMTDTTGLMGDGSEGYKLQ